MTINLYILNQDKASVVVHGSDGRDLTLCVTSLAQVILNPDCRTVSGFEALIEREWLQVRTIDNYHSLRISMAFKLKKCSCDWCLFYLMCLNYRLAIHFLREQLKGHLQILYHLNPNIVPQPLRSFLIVFGR